MTVKNKRDVGGLACIFAEYLQAKCDAKALIGYTLQHMITNFIQQELILEFEEIGKIKLILTLIH